MSMVDGHDRYRLQKHDFLQCVMQMENKNQVEISISNEMDGIAETKMKKKLSSVRSLDSKCCIYNVPEFIKKGKEECYQPSIVSIGPAYYKDKKLQSMQQYKWFFLETFLKHPDNACRNSNSYIDIVREKKKDIRDCYDELLMTSCYDDDEFIEMMVLDAIFLLCVFMFVKGDEFIKNHTYASNKLQVLMTYMRRDICLEENQLPFFVLQRIFDLAFPTQLPSLMDLACGYIEIFEGYPGSDYVATMGISGERYIEHFIDLWRACCSSPIVTQQVKSKHVEFPMTAKQLHAAGVKFKKSESLNPLSIIFNSKTGELHIPQLTIDEHTEAFLRNFLHFEQCHYFCKHQGYFIDLFFFLDSLIDSAEDIQLLQKKRILNNVLGSDDKAAILFNNITTDIWTTFYKNHFTDVSKDVNAYANQSLNRWLAILRRNYFSHPWALISLIYAILLFILTVIQTITGFTER